MQESLKNCVAVIKTMHKMNISYQCACKIVAKKRGKCVGTIQDACTRFGKGGKSCLRVSQVEQQVRTGKIIHTLKRKFPEHASYIDCQLGCFSNRKV